MVTIWDMYDSYEAVARLEAIGLYLTGVILINVNLYSLVSRYIAQ